MSGERVRGGRDAALGDALARVRALERSKPVITAPRPGTPISIPILRARYAQFDSAHINTPTLDTGLIGNGYLGSDGTDGAYFSFLTSVGPRGSIWGLGWTFVVGPDQGMHTVSIGSALSPNPNRAGVSDEGSLLEDSDVNYLDWLVQQDAYAPVRADSFHDGDLALRYMGFDFAPMTTLTFGADPYTGLQETDGGSGTYRIKFRADGKNALSSAFKMQITSITMFRVDDNGFT